MNLLGEGQVTAFPTLVGQLPGNRAALRPLSPLIDHS
jgi:hypothetical protein